MEMSVERLLTMVPHDVLLDAVREKLDAAVTRARAELRAAMESTPPHDVIWRAHTAELLSAALAQADLLTSRAATLDLAVQRLAAIDPQPAEASNVG